MVDILLQNGAEVNAVNKVIVMNGQTGFKEMHVSVVEMKVRVWEQHWLWQIGLSQLSMDKVDEVSWHQFAHPCKWDRLWLMMHIVWHAFLAVTRVCELP